MNTSKLGKEGEDRAAAYLEQVGMRVIARNVRSKCGEIDIVALEGLAGAETIVFAEVKRWSAYGIEELRYGINSKKRLRIIETAKYFLASHREYNSMTARFDVVFISPEKVTHIAAAFMEDRDAGV